MREKLNYGITLFSFDYFTLESDRREKFTAFFREYEVI